MTHRSVCGKEDTDGQEANGNIPTPQGGQVTDRLAAYFKELIQIATEVEEQSEESSHLRTG